MISSSVGWNRKPGGKSMRSSPLFTTEASSIGIKSPTRKLNSLYIGSKNRN
uniref:Uncharacterized protein n=1 Tax=Rhizophora mucronata TaxID=61149 RepID=A0A2P2NAH2_RHIMU